ncbi:TetR/AcrR family transcriptional regulator [Streptosporangium saharense]|uniref:AcrR family transcriptional regulator n=1 Tax=Streptosporangium saharense TaxID=1706840 RepID=A0A7W7VP44_9ACTN|nr:TetR/AcrR family transcriptional regulator [Streptosporangium saharense]MBB4917293.1 AcrR family transcriptional regulator [Streptosporangium saharense]
MTTSTRAEARSARKRQEILTAARSVFTAQGYVGTSMDAVAAAAGASKRTVYQYFADKEELFAGVVLDTVDRGYEYFRPAILALAEADDLETALRDHARMTLAGLMNPEILQMRRLVIAEAERFPAIGREYFERSWGRTLKLLAETFAKLTERGLLNTPDPERAAYMFTWLIVSIPTGRSAFLGDAAIGSPEELTDLADEGTRVFLAAFARR